MATRRKSSKTASAKKKTIAKTPVRREKSASATQPVPASDVLSELERRFCEEYLVDLNGTKAYLRFKPGVKETTARTEASKLLAKPNVQVELARLRKAQSDRTGIKADVAVQEAWAMMTADPRELMEYRIGCCRHCWGKGFAYQRSDSEFGRARDAHAQRLVDAKNDGERKAIGSFDPLGGAGFNVSRAPNSACPECGGDGQGRAIFKDTRTISPAAASLFAGVKETKDGLEIKLHSKDAAMDKVFRHLGLYNDKVQLTLPTVLVRDFTGRKGRIEE